MSDNEWNQWCKRMRATLKSRYTKARNSGTTQAWEKVQEQCTLMREYFEAEGYPDWWSIIDRYESDAYNAIDRNEYAATWG